MNFLMTTAQGNLRLIAVIVALVNNFVFKSEVITEEHVTLFNDAWVTAIDVFAAVTYIWGHIRARFNYGQGS